MPTKSSTTKTIYPENRLQCGQPAVITSFGATIDLPGAAIDPAV